MSAAPVDDATLIHLAADLLYERDDPRAIPWPDPQTLGTIQSRLRGLADDLEETP